MESATAGHGPLAGIKVVEMAAFVAAPFGAMMLADLGADVVKIEPPKGDPMRTMGRHPAGISPMWVSTNRGKRGMALDLKSPEGVETARQLLREADILICNWRPAVAERLGFSDGSLVAANLRLIRIYTAGFGPSGPLAATPAYDAIIQARLGLTEANGDESGPALEKSFIVDKVAGTMVCQAALAALAGRELHGVADRVDLAMLDAVAYVNFPDIMVNRLFLNHAPASARNVHPSVVQPTPTADGWVVVVPVTAAQVRRTFEAVGHPEVYARLMEMADGMNIVAGMYRELAAILPGDTTEAWLRRLAAHDVPVSSCLTIDEHLADAQVLYNELYNVVEWPDWPRLGPVRQVRYPAVFGSWGKLRPALGPPPIAADAGHERPASPPRSADRA